MKKVLIAGATGYLGQFVVKALKVEGYWIRALGRSAAKLAPVEEYADELFIGEVTDPVSLTGLCDGIDIVFSSIGITRQRDGLTYKDVDYQANRNLLTIAEAAGVSQFMYVHVMNAEKLAHVAMVQAKQAFVDDLKRSTLDHTVICPTGFFSDMEEILAMARSGRVYLFGDGSNRINPVHGADLAEVCASALVSSESEIDVGGPEVFTYREIAGLAFDALEQREKIMCIPKYFVSATVGALRWLAPAKVYGPVQFMASVMTMDVIGQPRGQRRLADHFRDCTRTIGGKTHKMNQEPRVSEVSQSTNCVQRMRVEDLENYGASLEMPKEAVKAQFGIMLKALRRQFGFWGMLGVFLDTYFIQRRLRRDYPETRRRAAELGKIIENELFTLSGTYLALAKRLGRNEAYEFLKYEVIHKLALTSMPLLYQVPDLKKCEGDVFENFKKMNIALFDRTTKDGTWLMESFKDEPDKLTIRVTTCTNVELFNELNVPELGKFGCDHDVAGYPAIEKDVNCEFRRFCTIANGDDYCLFEFYRRGTAPDNAHLNI